VDGHFRVSLPRARNDVRGEIVTPSSIAQRTVALAPLALAAAAAAHSGQYVAPDHIRSASSRFPRGSVLSGLCFHPEARSSSIAKNRATRGASNESIGDPRKQRSHHAKCLVLDAATSTR
jgi:hypothetical protein